MISDPVILISILGLIVGSFLFGTLTPFWEPAEPVLAADPASPEPDPGSEAGPGRWDADTALAGSVPLTGAAGSPAADGHIVDCGGRPRHGDRQSPFVSPDRLDGDHHGDRHSDGYDPPNDDGEAHGPDDAAFDARRPVMLGSPAPTWIGRLLRTRVEGPPPPPACPYCWADVNLDTCPVVATNLRTDGDGVRRPVSGADISGHVGDYPVVWRPEPHTTWAALFGGEGRTDPAAVGRAEDLPARICGGCATPLPSDFGDRPVFTVGVLGTTSSTKTHFLAAALHSAYHDQALGPMGCHRFAPDEETADQFHALYTSCFYGGRVLPNTKEDDQIRFKPLSFTVTRDNRPLRLLFHDVTGEAFTNRKKRAVITPFVSRAGALIFLIDPVAFAPVRDHLRSTYGIDPGPPDYNQAVLVNAVAADLRRHRTNLAELPVAAVLSKSDLVSATLGRPLPFDHDPPADPDRWWSEIATIDRSVRAVLADFGAADLLSAFQEFPLTTFCAVAPLGTQPVPDPDDRDGFWIVDQVRPRRCIDPIAVVLQ